MSATASAPDPEESIPNSEELDEAWKQYQENYMKFEEKIKNNLTDYKFMDCLKKYSKMLLTISKSNPETLKRHMYGFGKSLKKKKNSHLIPILGVSRSRRKYKHSGKGNAPYGRRVNDTALKTQMEVRDDEDDGIVYHSLPKQKRRPKRLVHSLSKAVEENRANAKKH